MRGTVAVAGKRLQRRSRRRTGWKVAETQFAFAPDLAERGLMVYRSLLRHAASDVLASAVCIQTAIAVRKQFPAEGPPPSHEELCGLLESHWPDEKGKPFLRLQAFYAAREIAQFWYQPWVKDRKTAETEPEARQAASARDESGGAVS